MIKNTKNMHIILRKLQLSFFKAGKKCVNAELVYYKNNSGNFILYGQKRPLKYVLGKRYSGNLKKNSALFKI